MLCVIGIWSSHQTGCQSCVEFTTDVGIQWVDMTTFAQNGGWFKEKQPRINAPSMGQCSANLTTYWFSAQVPVHCIQHPPSRGQDGECVAPMEVKAHNGNTLWEGFCL